ncbi:hypothetical protein JCM10449v2_006389 [Rhodotorula kratochvilovae]
MGRFEHTGRDDARALYRPSLQEPPQDEDVNWSQASTHDDDWMRLRVWPPLDGANPLLPGTVLYLEATVPESFQPLDFKAFLLGQSEVLQPASPATTHTFLSTPPSTFQLLGNTFLDMQFKNPVRSTLRLPPRVDAHGACEGGELPRSWEGEGGRVRYEVVFEGRGLGALMAERGLAEERKEKGKGKAREGDGPDFRLAIPFIVAPPPMPSTHLFPPVLDAVEAATFARKHDLSADASGRIARRGGIAAELVDGLTTDALQLRYEITTPSITSSSSSSSSSNARPSLNYSFTAFLVSPGTLTRPASLAAMRSHPCWATLRIQRVFTGLALADDARPHAVTRTTTALVLAPAKSGETAGAHAVSNAQRAVRMQPRRVGEGGVAEGVEIQFDGRLEVFDAEASREGVLPSVRSCNLEVRYDLVAKLHCVDSSTSYTLRTLNIPLHLPAALASPVRVDPPLAAPPKPDGRPVGCVRLLDQARAIDLTPSWDAAEPEPSPQAGPSRLTAEDPALPPYELPLGVLVRQRLEKTSLPDVADAPSALQQVSTPAPPEYNAAPSALGPPPPSSAAPAPSRISRFLRRSRAPASPAVAPSAPPVAPVSPPSLPAPPPLPLLETTVANERSHAHEPPPSWEETVRDDMIDDWVVASAVLGAEAE